MSSSDPNVHEMCGNMQCVSKMDMWLKDHHGESWEGRGKVEASEMTL